MEMMWMQDCRITIEIKEDKVLVNAEQVDMVELATMCGALEQIMGKEALKRGMDIEDVKGNMLDIHLAAMQMLTEQVLNEKRR